MSLDVNLIFDRDITGGESVEAYTANITHNLGRMAEAAGIKTHLWYPDKYGFNFASELIVPLERGLEFLQSDPEHFKKFNPENGWGDYNSLISFVKKYLDACKKYPKAKVSVSV